MKARVISAALAAGDLETVAYLNSVSSARLCRTQLVARLAYYNSL